MGKTTNKKGKASAKKNTCEVKRQLLFKTDDQEYAFVDAMLGNSRISAQCVDDKKRVCKIRGSMAGRRKRRNLISKGDWVLISLRPWEDDKGDIIAVYTPDEVRSLKSFGEIPNIITGLKEEKEEDAIDFGEDSEQHSEDGKTVDEMDFCVDDI